MLRAVGRLRIDGAKEWQTFQSPSLARLVMLAIGVSTDIKVLKWNLLRNPALLKDPDLPISKKIAFSDFEETVTGNSNTYKFILESVYYVFYLFNGEEIAKISLVVEKSDTLYSLLTLQASYFEKSNQYFKDRQLAKRPAMKDKYDDTYKRMKNQSEDIKKILVVADIIRGDIGEG